MAYSNQTLTKLNSKKFIIGIVMGGVLSVGLAAPSAAGAISLGGDSSSNAIEIGTMSSDSLQGSSWSAQAWSTNKSEAMASGANESRLQVQNSNEGSDSSVSGSGSLQAASQNSANNTREQENIATMPTDVQGGIGLNVNFSGSSDTSHEDQGGLLNL